MLATVFDGLQNHLWKDRLIDLYLIMQAWLQFLMSKLAHPISGSLEWYSPTLPRYLSHLLPV